jgi:hypothetical protein
MFHSLQAQRNYERRNFYKELLDAQLEDRYPQRAAQMFVHLAVSMCHQVSCALFY